jgi:hypothetical protein
MAGALAAAEAEEPPPRDEKAEMARLREEFPSLQDIRLREALAQSSSLDEAIELSNSMLPRFGGYADETEDADEEKDEDDEWDAARARSSDEVSFKGDATATARRSSVALNATAAGFRWPWESDEQEEEEEEQQQQQEALSPEEEQRRAEVYQRIAQNKEDRKREDALHARPWDNDFDGLQAAGTAIVTAQESLQDAMKKADDMLKGVTSMRVEELDAAIKGAVRAGVNGGLVSEASDKLERVRAMAAEAATISTCEAWCEPQFEMSKTGNLCANADCGACGFCDAAATQLRAEDAYGWRSVDDPNRDHDTNRYDKLNSPSTSSGWGASDPGSRPGRDA